MAIEIVHDTGERPVEGTYPNAHFFVLRTLIGQYEAHTGCIEDQIEAFETFVDSLIGPNGFAQAAALRANCGLPLTFRDIDNLIHAVQGHVGALRRSLEADRAAMPATGDLFRGLAS